MGASSWDSKDWSAYSSATKSKPAEKIFTRSTVLPEMSPFGVKLRECRDSDVNPITTPIIIALDTTGSMGHISEYMAKDGLGTLVENVLSRKPVVGPQIMFNAFQDADYNGQNSFQIGQFEADIVMTKWLEAMVHGGGGGNNIESYDLPYYFAAYHTATDAMEKRGKKGYIFTIGDEEAPQYVKKAHLKAILGVDVQDDILFSDLITVVKQMYCPYHIIVAQGSYAKSHMKSTKASWDKVLGQNVLVLDDYTKIAELIVSVLEVENGIDAATTASSWSGSTALTVSAAISHLPATRGGDSGGVVRL